MFLEPSELPSKITTAMRSVFLYAWSVVYKHKAKAAFFRSPVQFRRDGPWSVVWCDGVRSGFPVMNYFSAIAIVIAS